MTARDEYCPVTRSLDLFGDRWGLLLVREILRGVSHFNELERSLPGISRSTLATRLRRLERDAIVERRIVDEGPGTEYRLTDAGRDLTRVIEAMGIWGRHVERSEDLPGAVDAFLAHDGPALLDVVTERQELSIPPAITAEHVKGFSLYALRTVLSGQGSELVDLARVNLRQIL